MRREGRIREAISKAYASVEANEDGSRDEKRLLDELIKLLPYDDAGARLKYAKDVLAKHTKPGAYEPDGQLAIPGLEAFGYEPDRLIGNGHGQVVRQDDARPEFKSAEAARAMENLEKVSAWATRKSRENNAYAQWAFDQITRHQRPVIEITFGNFVRESGWWRPDEAPPEMSDELV